MKTIRWPLFLLGTLLTLTGVAFLVWPFMAASWILAIIIGLALISSGIAALASPGFNLQKNSGEASRGPNYGANKGANKFFGVILLVLGVLALTFNQVTANFLVTAVGVMIISVSVIWLLFGLSLRAGASPLMFGPAVFGILFGMVPIIWPEFAMFVIAVFFGFLTTVWGVITIRKAFNEPSGIKVIKIIRSS